MTLEAIALFEADDGAVEELKTMSHRVCPFWLGYFLLCPLRLFAHKPEKVFGDRVREGMTALDIGCAMGFFSLPLARRVGPSGKVLCVDVQERMLAKLGERACEAGLADRIGLRLASPESLGLEEFAGGVDFALAFAVVHEVPDAGRLLAQVFGAMKPGAPLVVAEPVGHVRGQAFEAEVAAAREAGFEEVERPHIPRTRAVVLKKPQGTAAATDTPPGTLQMNEGAARGSRLLAPGSRSRVQA